MLFFFLFVIVVSVSALPQTACFSQLEFHTSSLTQSLTYFTSEDNKYDIGLKVIPSSSLAFHL